MADPAELRLIAAGRDPALSHSDVAWIDRIAGEFAAASEALSDIGPAVSVFGSARTPADHPEYLLARRVAAAVGHTGTAIITGGGAGIMEAANRGARDAGALSIGLTIELRDAEQANGAIDRRVHFRYFFARKIAFVRYALAFVVFPGGLGTLDELFELLTLIQTHKVRQAPVVLVGSEYWKPLLDWMRGTLLAEGKISPRDIELAHLADTPEVVLARLNGVLPGAGQEAAAAAEK